MTADTALRLERWLGVSAAFWMNLQKRYELDIAREKSDDIMKMIEPLPQTSRNLKVQQFRLLAQQGNKYYAARQEDRR